MKILVIGAGWLGTQLATQLKADGHELWVSSRSAAKSSAVAEQFSHFVLDLAQSVRPTPQLEALFKDAVVICTVPASRSDGEGYLRALAQLASLMKLLGSTACIHLSTTGVYEGLSGDVNEQSLLQLADPRIELLAVGEQLLNVAVPCCTLRLAGLIGPGRHPARFLSGKQAGAADVAVNMVHSSDVCAAVSAIVQQRLWPELFNLSSPAFCSKAEFYLTACELASLPAPEFEAKTAPSSGRRVVSTKSQTIAGFSYTFDSALAALAFCS
jgi:nucleoside-diphosphate-sugar epimerase